MAQQTMKALVKRHAEKGIWMEQVPVPSPGPNEVLIKLEKTAICGTDLHIYKWDEWSQRTIKPGLVIGHEFVGRVVEMGPGVTGYQLGDRVLVGAVASEEFASKVCSIHSRVGALGWVTLEPPRSGSP